MRDLIWTVIILWVVWKLYDAFKNVTKTRTQPQGQNSNTYNYRAQKEGEVKIDTSVKPKSHFKPGDGEYVDYEEVN